MDTKPKAEREKGGSEMWTETARVTEAGDGGERGRKVGNPRDG